MGIEQIPETFRYVCDACGKSEVLKFKARYPRQWGQLDVIVDAYDFQGAAVGDGSIYRMLCPHCLDVVTTAINVACKGLKRD